jgi:hypothetical protein
LVGSPGRKNNTENCNYHDADHDNYGDRPSYTLDFLTDWLASTAALVFHPNRFATLGSPRTASTGKQLAFAASSMAVAIVLFQNIGEGRGAAHMLPARRGAAAAFRRAGADKVALHVGQPAQDGNHQPPGAGRGVGPTARPVS